MTSAHIFSSVISSSTEELDGAYGDATQVSGSVPQISPCTRGSANASSHGGTPTIPVPQPAAPFHSGDGQSGLREFPGMAFESAAYIHVFSPPRLPAVSLFCHRAFR